MDYLKGRWIGGIFEWTVRVVWADGLRFCGIFRAFCALGLTAIVLDDAGAQVHRRNKMEID